MSEQTTTTMVTGEDINAIVEKVSWQDFVKAYFASVADGTGMAGVAQKTGLQPATCTQRASSLRNPKYRQTTKLIGGEKVYQLGKIHRGEDGVVETTDHQKAKTDKQGKAMLVKVNATDASNKPILLRDGLKLPAMPRGGSSRINMSEAELLLAELTAQYAPSED